MEPEKRNGSHSGRPLVLEVLVPAILLFSIAGSSCALARDFEVLLILRFLQGAGAASLGSLNATLIGDFFSGRQRIEVIGYSASILSVGTAVYPALGGAPAVLGWYVPFALPILGVPVAMAVLVRLESVWFHGPGHWGRHERGISLYGGNRIVPGPAQSDPLF